MFEKRGWEKEEVEMRKNLAENRSLSQVDKR